MRLRTMLVSRAFPALLAATIAGCAGARSAPLVDPLTVGDLPQPVATMTGDQLWTVGRGLGWTHGRKQERDCAGGSCKARIDAVAGQQPPGPSRISPNGTIVGRFVNKGGGLFGGDRGAENKYGFEKRDGTEYYLIAIPNGSAPGGWSWIVREARSGDTGTTPMKDGSWVTCTADANNPNHPPAGTKSEFYTCNTGPGDGTLMLYSRTAPGWLDCEQGCCTAGQ